MEHRYNKRGGEPGRNQKKGYLPEPRERFDAAPRRKNRGHQQDNHKKSGRYIGKYRGDKLFAEKPQEYRR